MIMRDTDFKTRFQGAPWMEKERPAHVVIGGCGGIGSWTAFCLGRIGLDMSLFDYDIVEDVNIAGQLFSSNDVGELKTHAIKSLVHKYSNETNIYTYDKLMNGSLDLAQRRAISIGFVPTIYISAFDNMKSRKVMFQEAYALTGGIDYFIDGRMLAESFELYVVDLNSYRHRDEYRKTLFSDDIASPESCSYKATSHIAMHLASLITTTVTNIITNFDFDNECRKETPPRELIEKLSFHAPFNLLTEESWI